MARGRYRHPAIDIYSRLMLSSGKRDRTLEGLNAGYALQGYPKWSEGAQFTYTTSRRAIKFMYANIAYDCQKLTDVSCVFTHRHKQNHAVEKA